MKLLYLLRHTKSSWDDPSIDDFERPLNKRGRKAATLLADYCRHHEIRPEIVLCSPAKRTRQTLESLQSALGNAPVAFERRLYEATSLTILALIAELPRNCHSALVIGHNPGLQRLARYLVDADSPNPALRHLGDKLPTGGFVTLSAQINEWDRLTAGGCTLDGFLRPGDLDGEGESAKP